MNRTKIINLYKHIDENNNICNGKERETYLHYLSVITKDEKSSQIGYKLEDYVMKVHGDDKAVLRTFAFNPISHMCYSEEYGYFALDIVDRDFYIYIYGNTKTEAFYNAIIDFEFDICKDIELLNRKKLNYEYSKRFLSRESNEDDYHGPFFFAELSLQFIRKYYGDNIPEDIINYYTLLVSEYTDMNLEYDYGKNCFIKSSKNNGDDKQFSLVK